MERLLRHKIHIVYILGRVGVGRSEIAVDPDAAGGFLRDVEGDLRVLSHSVISAKAIVVGVEPDVIKLAIYRLDPVAVPDILRPLIFSHHASAHEVDFLGDDAGGQVFACGLLVPSVIGILDGN